MRALLLIVLLATNAPAATLPDLFTITGPPREDPETGLVYPVKVNAAGLLDPAVDEVKLTLPDGREIKVALDRREPGIHGVTSWFGKLPQPMARAAFASDGRHLAVHFMLPGELPFEVRPCPGGHELLALNGNMRPCAGAHRPEEAAPSAKSPSTRQDSGERYDLLMIYTRPMADSLGAGIYAHAQDVVNITNQCYTNSLIETRARLVAVETITYAEAGFAGTDIDRLNKPFDGFADEAHVLRDRYGADMVAMVVKEMSDAAGVANGKFSTGPADSEYAFLVMDGDYTAYQILAHEAGHNQGCDHDRNNSAGVNLFPYSFGVQRPTFNFRTVMAYPCDNRACLIADVFASPDVLYNGVPTGFAAGSLGQADTRLTINRTAASVANYRAEKTPSALPTWTPVPSGELPNLGPLAGEGWDGPIVVSTEQGTNTQAETVLVGQSVFIDISFANLSGPALTTRGDTMVLVSVNGAYLYEVNYELQLNPGEPLRLEDREFVPARVGSFEVKVRLDPYGHYGESDETDNDFSYRFDVVAAVPDPTPTPSPLLTGAFVEPFYEWDRELGVRVKVAYAPAGERLVLLYVALELGGTFLFVPSLGGEALAAAGPLPILGPLESPFVELWRAWVYPLNGTYELNWYAALIDAESGALLGELGSALQIISDEVD